MQNKPLVPILNIPIADGLSIPMVTVEGGDFMMGRDAYRNENPIHPVKIASFEIGQYPVTQALWQGVMQDNPSHFKGADLPVEQISWDDTRLFLEKLNALPNIQQLNEQDGRRFRLPTEAQWEYAARGGRQSLGFPYAGSHQLKEVGWFRQNSHRATKPVGLKLPNELCLYDMSGNVWEWCADHWQDDYKKAPQDGSAWAESNGAGRVVRGGSWNINDDFCRVSYRYFLFNAVNRSLNIGFRLARY